MSDSYYMDTTSINIHLEYQDAETKTITAKAVKENTQTTNVVSKVDVTGSKKVDGCKLEITDASGKKVISWTSGDKDSVKVYVTEKDGYQTITTTYAYDGYNFQIEAEADAVQTHNAKDAIKSAWGVDVNVSDDETSLSLQ